jgi:hypothetical protein
MTTGCCCSPFKTGAGCSDPCDAPSRERHTLAQELRRSRFVDGMACEVASSTPLPLLARSTAWPEGLAPLVAFLWIAWRFGPMLTRLTGWCAWWVAWSCGSQGGCGYCVALLVLGAFA